MGRRPSTSSPTFSCSESCRNSNFHQEKLKSIGVKIVTEVDKAGFTAVADPLLDKLAKELGPHAEKIKNLIRAIN